MCGIFAYTGIRNNAGEIVLSGLKTLEYRGYDSWGIAQRSNNAILIDKRVGKIGQVKKGFLRSNIAIGHTRWATHGGATQKNAHPHLDCTGNIALLHNGIIENYTTLKEKLLKEGHIFISETDTETAVHLIEKFLKKMSFEEAVRQAFKLLSGMNAIVVINNQTQEIIAIKNGSPLVIGVGHNEFFIASDVVGIIPYTKNVVFVEDNTMAIINKKFTIKSISNGNLINYRVKKLDWVFETTQKGKYKHFFIKEIHEEPRVIKNIAINSLDSTKKLSELIKKSYGTFMLACGSASYAGIAATYLLSKIAKRHVNFGVGSEFKYLEDYITNKTLVIPISQSGESIDVIEPITRAKKKGAKIAAITNVLGSTLYRISDFKVLLDAGPEKAVVATKSFTAMIALILLTAYTLAGKQKEGQALLIKAAKDVAKILEDSYIKKVKKTALKLKLKEHVYIIGRGLAYTAALETTLKLKEGALIHAEAFPGGELKHGVIALIEKGTPVIVFAPNDETYEEIISNAQEVKARGAYIIGIGPKENSVFDEFLPTADISEATLLSQVAVAHLLGYYLAIARGIADPDKPRNLAKSVTVK